MKTKIITGIWLVFFVVLSIHSFAIGSGSEANKQSKGIYMEKDVDDYKFYLKINNEEVISKADGVETGKSYVTIGKDESLTFTFGYNTGITGNLVEYFYGKIFSAEDSSNKPLSSGCWGRCYNGFDIMEITSTGGGEHYESISWKPSDTSYFKPGKYIFEVTFYKDDGMQESWEGTTIEQMLFVGLESNQCAEFDSGAVNKILDGNIYGNYLGMCADSTKYYCSSPWESDLCQDYGSDVCCKQGEKLTKPNIVKQQPQQSTYIEELKGISLQVMNDATMPCDYTYDIKVAGAPLSLGSGSLRMGGFEFVGGPIPADFIDTSPHWVNFPEIPLIFLIKFDSENCFYKMNYLDQNGNYLELSNPREKRQKIKYKDGSTYRLEDGKIMLVAVLEPRDLKVLGRKKVNQVKKINLEEEIEEEAKEEFNDYLQSNCGKAPFKDTACCGPDLKIYATARFNGINVNDVVSWSEFKTKPININVGVNCISKEDSADFSFDVTLNNDQKEEMFITTITE